MSPELTKALSDYRVAVVNEAMASNDEYCREKRYQATKEKLKEQHAKFVAVLEALEERANAIGNPS